QTEKPIEISEHYLSVRLGRINGIGAAFLKAALQEISVGHTVHAPTPSAGRPITESQGGPPQATLGLGREPLPGFAQCFLNRNRGIPPAVEHVALIFIVAGFARGEIRANDCDMIQSA